MVRHVGGLSHGQVFEQLVLNRLDDPLPLLYLEDWAEMRGIRELYGIPPEKLNDDRIGRALDAVAPFIDDIEGAVVLAALSRFNVDPDQVLWDTTSFYFEGDYDESDIIKLGYSRDQKKDKKQAVVELSVTAKEGIPLAHRLLPGNASDHKEALQNIKTLQKRVQKKDFLLIGDRAMLTKPNLTALIGKGLKFLGPLAGKDKEFILGIPEEQFVPLTYTTARGKGGCAAVDTSYTFHYNGRHYTCRAVVVKNEELCKQQRLTLNKNLRKIESGLEKIRCQLNVRKYKNPAYVAERVKKVLDGHCAGKLFRVILDGEEGALTLQWDYDPGLMEQQERLLGKYILVTSLDREAHDADRVLELYKSRHRVEDRIRAIKGTLKIRPLFLQSEERIKSLVLVNIIALIVYSLIEWVCKQKRFARSGKHALFMFRMPAIVTLTVNGHVNQQIGNIYPSMHYILTALKVKPLEISDMDTG